MADCGRVTFGKNIGEIRKGLSRNWWIHEMHLSQGGFFSIHFQKSLHFLDWDPRNSELLRSFGSWLHANNFEKNLSLVVANSLSPAWDWWLGGQVVGCSQAFPRFGCEKMQFKYSSSSTVQTPSDLSALWLNLDSQVRVKYHYQVISMSFPYISPWSVWLKVPNDNSNFSLMVGPLGPLELLSRS